MTLVVITAHFAKQVPKIVKYCDYKMFSNDLFMKEVEQILSPDPEETLKYN